MKVGKIAVYVGIAFMVSICCNSTAYARQAVASIKDANGWVQIERGNNPKKKLMGRVGLILHEHDVIVTGSDSKATILFRDGTEIRVFRKTRFEVRQSKESFTADGRNFINRILLSFGSFWGKFVRGKQHTLIKTPTVTAGIKGTIAGFSEKEGRFSASLSSGAMEIGNEDGSIDLMPGQMVTDVRRTGSIRDRISPLPYQIEIWPKRQKISLPKPKEQTSFYFTLQLKNAVSNENVNKPGAVYISSDSSRIAFPEKVRLNAEGYARIQATVTPFSEKGHKNERLEIAAAMDSGDLLHVGAGRAIIEYDTPATPRKVIKIDGSSGKID